MYLFLNSLSQFWGSLQTVIPSRYDNPLAIQIELDQLADSKSMGLVGVVDFLDSCIHQAKARGLALGRAREKRDLLQIAAIKHPMFELFYSKSQIHAGLSDVSEA